MSYKIKPRWLGKRAKKRLKASNSKSLFQWSSMQRKREENFELAQTEKRNNHEGHVYAFRIKDDLYKIGRTYNIENRIKSLRAGNPDIKCIWSSWSPDCHELEKSLHVHMKEYHVDREFFRLSSENIMQINTLALNFNNKYKIK